MAKVIYPGTFDPITLGHVNILEKASDIFDEVVLAVADYTGKNPMFALEERFELCRQATEHLPKVKVMMFHGLFVDFARSQKCKLAELNGPLEDFVPGCVAKAMQRKYSG